MGTALDKFGRLYNTLSTLTNGELQARGSTSFGETDTVIGNNAKYSGRKETVPDHRVRISPKPGIPGSISNDIKKSIFGPIFETENVCGTLVETATPIKNIMEPLHKTNGVIFPFTPVITATLQADYSQYAPVHANQDFHTYQRTPSAQYNIAGTFTAQTDEEARYALAVIHFFRTITKMHFGKDDPKAGLVPPVLMLNGYGKYMFNNLPIIINNYTVELMNDVDYIEVDVEGQNYVDQVGFGSKSRPKLSSGTAWIPSRFLMTVNCIVQHTPSRLREFNLDEFRTGELMKKDYDRGGWW